MYLSSKLLKLVALTCATVNTLAYASDDSPTAKKISNWFKGIDKSKVIVAINCGGSENLVDDDGMVYKADEAYAKGGQTTSGCGMHKWPLANSELYHAERWGENFSYELPMSLARDSQYTLILKFSECYFWEPGMKVFDL